MRAAATIGVAAIATLFLSLAFGFRDAPSQGQRESLLFPRPVPLSSLSLPALERWQVAALRHYRGAYLTHERVADRRVLNRREWIHRRWFRLATAWTARELGETRERLRLRRLDDMGARDAICYVFGGYCSQALAVAYCETGGTFSVYARNGQYLGLFQMGEYARSEYGHSWTALGQARAAYRYFRDAGGWGPWSCKP